jgi:hypothetical protein
VGLKIEPGYIGQTGYLHPVELDRNMLEGQFQRSGGVRYGDFAISQGVGTRAIAIAPGRFFVLGQENAQQGGYFVWSDAVETFLLAAAVGNPRIDTLLIRVIDDQYGTISGAPRAEFAVVQGVAAASPTARPDSDFNVGGSFYIPGGWARLGDVRVNVADTGSIPTGQITTKNRYVRGPADVVPCLSTDRPSDPVLSDRIFEIDTAIERFWNGTFWQQTRPYVLYTQLASPAADFTFTVPSTFRTFRVTYFARCVGAVVVDNFMMRINNVTPGHVYNRKSQSGTTITGLSNDQGNNHFPIGLIPGANGGAAGDYGDGEVLVNGWASPNSARMKVLWNSGCYTSTSIFHEDGQGMVTNAAPFTSFRLFANGGSNLQTGSYARVEAWDV